MTSKDNEELVSRFRSYLEKAGDEREEAPPKLDLFSFYSELIALKNEVKIESRLIKQGLDHFQETSGLIEQGNLMLHSLVEGKNADKGNKGGGTDLPIILKGLLDLYDGICASLQTLPDPTRPGPWYRWKRRGDTKVIDSIHEGQEMLKRRVVDLLADCGAQPMEVADHEFDPRTMRAVGADSIPGLGDGMVSREIRTGFTLNGEILRLADVRVNRHKPASGLRIITFCKNLFKSTTSVKNE